MCMNDIRSLIGGSPPPAPAPPPPPDYSGASRNAINAPFDTTFTPSFYDTRRRDYVTHYQPELDQQLSRAKDALYTGLVGRGMDASNVGNKFTSDLSGAYDTQKTQVASNADAELGKYRGRVEADRMGLLSQATAASDPTSLGKMATQHAVNLSSEKPSYSPLGDVFASLIAPLASKPANTFVPGQTQTFAATPGADQLNLAGGGTDTPRKDKTRVVQG